MDFAIEMWIFISLGNFKWSLLENKINAGLFISPKIFLQNSLGSDIAELRVTMWSLHWYFYNAVNFDFGIFGLH